MTWVLLLLGALPVAGSGLVTRRLLFRRRERRLEVAEHFRLSRRAADEDVTRLGEELVELHFETLATPLDDAMRTDYQEALDRYDDAKQRVRDAEDAAAVTAVTRILEEARFRMACLLARQDGRDLPARRAPCFFDPGHGPATADVEWAPPNGTEREVPVCFRCRERLAAGTEPEIRRVQWGNRRVPWFQAGPAYAAYVEGYYGSYARAGTFPDFILPAMVLAPTAGVADLGGAWSGWGQSGLTDDGFGAYDWGGWHGTGSDAGFGFDFGGGGDGGGGGGDGG